MAVTPCLGEMSNIPVNVGIYVTDQSRRFVVKMSEN
jgi:hypothetical protein